MSPKKPAKKPEKKVDKKPVGRPPATVENCLPENWKDIILEMSAEGCSEVEIRAQLCLAGGKFNHDTWYALKAREQEFSETIQIGRILCQAWWERQGRQNLQSKIFQTGAWYANMKNRFGWRDTIDQPPGEMTFKDRVLLASERAREIIAIREVVVLKTESKKEVQHGKTAHARTSQ